jgi:hypothetical protein
MDTWASTSEPSITHGQVEVDETYLAITDREAPISPEKRKSNTSKVLVAVAVEMLQPKGFGRIRLQRIDNDSDACVVPFVQATHRQESHPAP